MIFTKPALVAKFGIDTGLLNDSLRLGAGTTAGSHAIQLQNLHELPAGNSVPELRSGLIKNIQQIIKGEPKIVNDLSKAIKFEGVLYCKSIC